MCLKAAQMCEHGEDVRLWADFGRFYDFRLNKLLDRIYADEDYGKNVCLAFNETPQQFLSVFNERLNYIHQNIWRGGGHFMWESIEEWRPRR